MNAKSVISNAATAFAAQGVSLGLSVVQSLLVPKLLGATEYGYWQLFLFYQSYVGFFHLGLNDGMYLVNGGSSRAQIDKRSVFSQFVLGSSVQAIVSLALALLALTADLGPEREFVLGCTALFLVVQNAASYLGFLFQAMNETKLFSYSAILERLVFLIPLLALIVCRVDRFEPFVVAYVFSSVCQLAFCLWHARDFLRAGFEGVPVAARECFRSVRVGVKLMLANIASMLVLGTARFLIDMVWGIETFGKLSFSLSMVNLFLSFVTQASMVLFPALRQSAPEEIRSFYVSARDALGLVFPVVYLLYFPMVWLLGLWLPAYAPSFAYFAILLPICVFDSKMNVTCTTFFKVMRKERTLLYVNVWTTVASAALSALGAFVVGSVYVVLGGVVVAIVGRSLYSEFVISRELHAPTSPITLGELLLTAAFVGCTALLPAPAALCSCLVAYMAFLALFRRRFVGLLRGLGRTLRAPSA